jgi:MEMO1 family protein
MADDIRLPAVAGMFYSGTPEALTDEIEGSYLDARGPGALPEVNPSGPRQLLGLVSPHAGYYYSGPMAAAGFSALAADGQPATFVLIGPNHGRGSWVSAVQTSGVWRTPLGDAQIDAELGSALAAQLPHLATGADAFQGEHSIEVQIPFLQHLYGDQLRFVPIMMLEQDWAAASRLGEALATVLAGRDVVIIASTDMTHQLPRAAATQQDQLLIERIATLDPEGLIRERDRLDITMCGYGPVAAMLVATKVLGAKQVKVFRYGDSGEAEPMARVVGYLSAGVYRG